MKKLLSMALAATMGLSLAACGGSSSNDGVTYTYSSELDIKNLDSADADDGCSLSAIHAVTDGLMKLDADGKLVNGVAESVEVSEDQLTHTYKIREDAKWSNGDDVTANDFVYAWHRIFENNGNYSYMFGEGIASIQGVDEIFAKIDAEEEVTAKDIEGMAVKAVDDKTLEVKTTIPVSFFDELMTFPCFYPINEKFAKEQGESYGKSADTVLGNGAFVMTNWEPGSVAEFKKSETYYDAANVKIDNLVMKLVQDPAVAATSFENGETDFAPINSDLVDKYKDNEAYKQINEGYLFYLQLNLNNPDLANANVRKALSLAINRDDFCEKVLKDGSKSAGGFVPSGLSISPKGEDFREQAGSYVAYDAKAAQEALTAGLKELGKKEITLRITYGTDESPMDKMATYLQNSFSQLEGLNIEMVATTKQDRIYNKQKNREFDIACTRWGPDYGDPTTYLTLMITGNSNNYGDYSNKKFDELMNKVATGTDLDARWQNMLDAEKVLMEENGVIPVFEKGTATLQNPAVKGMLTRPVGVPYTFAYVSK
ncbi:MAG: peptide ABC transporter substrate-binding protein [Bacillota bacterium]|nr:peptide ABC transporter substrate-binding protein [Bacillota bacterium]